MTDEEPNPAEKLQQVFGRIAATRMAGLPILNSALRVEAVGFRPWRGYWVGVLVTPWTLNLMLLPGSDNLEPLAPGQSKVWTFPSGSYEFMGLAESELEVCHVCPLISPLTEFATHEAAQAVAQEIIKELFVETSADDDLADMIEEARLKGESLGERSMSRRDFLRMPFMGR